MQQVTVNAVLLAECTSQHADLTWVWAYVN